jgi:DNA-binding MarR family transcriptional regulator
MSDSETMSEELDLELFFPFQLSVIANRVSQTIGNLISDHARLQIPEWRMLVVLKKYGPMSSADVAARTSMDKARVSRAQQRMIDLGLVSAKPLEDDKRKVILTLETEGERIYEEVLPLGLETEKWLLSSLTPAERAALENIMAKLFHATKLLESENPIARKKI